MSVLTLDRLSAGYRTGRPVLSELTLEAPPGLVQLHGVNGAGKSTLVEVLAGGLEPWSGRAQLYGRAVAQARPLRRVCRSRPALYPTLTVREHLDLLVDARVADRAGVLARCQRYGVDEWLDVPTEQLSTGNLRKAWLVLSTAPQVPLWLLDEPFNGLDGHGVRVLAEELEERVAEGLDVVLVAHQLPAGLPVTAVVELPVPALAVAG